MIFQHTLTQVLNGSKTQTRRIVQPHDEAVIGMDGVIVAIMSKGRTKWRVGKTYAVQPARTAAQVARIHMRGIRREVVTDINEADAIAEGYKNRDAFLQGWQRIHGENSLHHQVWALDFSLVAES